MKEILSEAQALNGQLIEWRRALHTVAETGTCLPRTAAFVESVLDELGIEHERLTDCGIVARIGSGERSILLRADMDALPGTERSGLPFAAEAGAVHACGHDIHTTMLLGAAKMLKAREQELGGCVVLMFQPGEETMTGAQEMVDAGILERFAPECAFAMHVNVADAPHGHIWIKKGAFCAASDLFEVEVFGKSGHGAHPHNAVNPIYPALSMISAFSEVSRYEIAPMVPNILTVCAIEAGNAGNVIPASCRFRGSLRTLDTAARNHVIGRLREITADMARAGRCEAEFRLISSIPVTENNEPLSQWALSQLRELLGEERTNHPHMPSMGSEDFSVISSRIPGCYMSVGIHRAAGCNVHLHNESIVFQEECFYVGSAAFAALARNYFQDAFLSVKPTVSDI